MANKIPVVVVGGSANALGVLRSLSHCELTLLCDSKQAPAWHSRHAHSRMLVADTRGASVVDDLLRLAASRQWPHRPVLLMTEEKTVVHVSASRERLEVLYEFLLCPEPLLSELQSKAGFQRLAHEARAPVPMGVVLESSKDLNKVQALKFPCVFKPLEQDATYSAQFKKAYKVASPQEVASLYLKIEPVMSRMIVQEWLEGEDSDIYFCLGFYDSSSRLIGSTFTGRKVRSWPLQVGGTASCTAAPESAEVLTRLTNDFVHSIGYVGQIGMEFKKDAKRGGFFMIEPTVGRTDYQHEIAPLSGSNILSMMVAWLAAQEVPGCRQPKAVIWYDEIADAKAIANGARTNLFLTRPRVAAVWRAKDPMPSLVDLARRAANRLRKFITRSQSTPVRRS